MQDNILRLHLDTAAEMIDVLRRQLMGSGSDVTAAEVAQFARELRAGRSDSLDRARAIRKMVRSISAAVESNPQIGETNVETAQSKNEETQGA